MTEHIIYGGDAERITELTWGDVFTIDMLYEALGKVYDGKHKVEIRLPKENIQTFQSENFFYLKPVEVLFDKDLKLFKAYGVEIAKVLTEAKSKPKKVRDEVYYVTTTVTCGKNICRIYTTIE